MNRQPPNFDEKSSNRRRQPLMSDDLPPESSPNDDVVNLVDVCQSILRIVARWEGKPYTESQLRQTVERQPDDPADPASAHDTPQG